MGRRRWNRRRCHSRCHATAGFTYAIALAFDISCAGGSNFLTERFSHTQTLLQGVFGVTAFRGRRITKVSRAREQCQETDPQRQVDLSAQHEIVIRFVISGSGKAYAKCLKTGKYRIENWRCLAGRTIEVVHLCVLGWRPLGKDE